MAEEGCKRDPNRMPMMAEGVSAMAKGDVKETKEGIGDD